MTISIDKATQRMSVKVDGVERHNWPVSTGKPGYSTPAGAFTPFRLEEDHYSKEWDEAPMPHSIFFTREGHAIHGSFDVKRLGTVASHGCVRLAPANAVTLFALVKAEGLNNVKVVISGEDQMIAKREAPAARQATVTREPLRDPVRITPDPGATGSISPRAEVYADGRRLDAYTSQMRRRYYEERYYDEPRPPREVYAPRYYEPQPYYYPRGAYRFGWQ